MIREVRRHGLWTFIDRDYWRTRPGAVVCGLWVTRTLEDRLLVEYTDLGFDYRGREAEPDDDDLEELHCSIDEAASRLRGDEVIRLTCWSRTGELLEIFHVDLRTGLKLERPPTEIGRSGHWTTVGVL